MLCIRDNSKLINSNMHAQHTDKSPLMRTTKSRLTVSPKSIPITHKVINRVVVPIYVSSHQRIETNRGVELTDVQRLQAELDMWVKRYHELELLYQQGGAQNCQQHLALIQQYQERLDQLTQENLSISQLLQARILEVQQWQASYKELQNQIHQFHSQRETVVIRERELQDIQIQISNLQTTIHSYEITIQELRNNVAVYQQECEKWKGKLQQSENERIKQLEEFRAQLESQRQHDVSVLMQTADQQRLQNEDEIQKMRMMIDQKHRETEQYRQQIHKLEQTLIEVGTSNQNYENKLTILTQEIENTNNIFQKKAQQFEQYRRKTQELEQHLGSQENEIQSLKQQYDECAQQVELWRSKYEQELMNHKRYEGNKMERERQISEELKRTQQMIEEREKRIQQLERQLSQNGQMQSQLIQNEDKLALLSQEIERLSSQLRQKEQLLIQQQSQTDQIQQKYYKSENTVIQTQNELQQISFSFKDLQQSYDQVKKQKMQLEERLLLLSAEVERLNDVQRLLTKEVENNRTRRQENETNDRFKIEQQQREIEELKRKSSQIDYYKSHMDQYQSDIERLNQLLTHAKGEIEQWRFSYATLESEHHQTSEMRVGQLSAEIDRLTFVIREKTTDNEKLKQRVYELEAELRQNSHNHYQIDEKFVMLTGEIERLNLLNLSYSEQIETLKIRCNKYEHSSQDSVILREKNSRLSEEIERLQGIIEDLTRELELFRLKYADQAGNGSRVEELLLFNAMYKVEIESLRMQLQEKEKEVSDLRRSSLAPYRK